MMNKTEFTEYVKDTIKDYLPEHIRNGCELQVVEVIKNNDTKLTGISLFRGENIPSPNFYIDDAFEAYRDGMRGIMEILAEQIEKAWDLELPFDIESFDYKDIKDHLTYQVVDVRYNRERLMNCPHTNMGNDLALIYYIEVHHDNGVNRLLVTHDLMEKKGFDENLLKHDAKLNMEKVNKGILLELPEAEVNLLEQDTDINGLGFYVLTNETCCGGASTLFYDGVKERIAEILQDDYYVIPSSVHEVMIMPTTGANVPFLAEVLKDANETVVSQEEFLSDRIFMYNSREQALEEVITPLVRRLDDMER